MKEASESGSDALSPQSTKKMYNFNYGGQGSDAVSRLGGAPSISSGALHIRLRSGPHSHR